MSAEFFLDGVRWAFRAAFDAMALAGVNVAIVAALSSGIYVHRDIGRAQMNLEIERLLAEVLDEVVIVKKSGQAVKRGQLFRAVVWPRVEPESTIAGLEALGFD